MLNDARVLEDMISCCGKYVKITICLFASMASKFAGRWECPLIAHCPDERNRAANPQPCHTGHRSLLRSRSVDQHQAVEVLRVRFLFQGLDKKSIVPCRLKHVDPA